MIPSDQVIIAPVLTEKANGLREQGKYVFRVDPRANKIMVKDAVRDLFNVHPTECRIVTVKSKPKRLRYRVPGRTAQWKKAIVTLKKGETIAVFEGG